MLTLDEIKAISFRKASFNGYRTEDVDKFIDDIVETVNKLTSEKIVLLKKSEQLIKKVEQYKASEDAVGIAMLSAQKIAEAAVKEAKEKAAALMNDATTKSDAMLKEAKEKADNLLKNATLRAKELVMEANEKAENIVYEANIAIKDNKDLLISLEREIASFRANIMREYKNHIKLIDSLPNKEQAENAINDLNEKYVLPDYVTPIDVTPYTVYDYPESTKSIDSNTVASESNTDAANVDDESNIISKPISEDKNEVDYGELNFKDKN